MIVEERDDAVFQECVERLTVLLVGISRFFYVSLDDGADRPAVRSVEPFDPPPV